MGMQRKYEGVQRGYKGNTNCIQKECKGNAKRIQRECKWIVKGTGGIQQNMEGIQGIQIGYTEKNAMGMQWKYEGVGNTEGLHHNIWGIAKGIRRGTNGIRREYKAYTKGTQSECEGNAKGKIQREFTGNTLRTYKGKGTQRERNGNPMGTQWECKGYT